MHSRTIPLHDLEGKWHIVLSNFPMWLKGDKTSPSLNYAVETKGTVTGLRDEVISQKRGKSQSIVGFDTPLDGANTRFLWRGKGLLSLLTSQWEIVHLEAHGEWAIIYFEKTLFTPEGYDVIARHKHLSPEILADIQSVLRECGITTSLRQIAQE
jgi:hypothetical protein